MEFKDRNIFKFFNGTKDVYMDPILIQTRMQTTYPKESSLAIDQKLMQVQIPPIMEDNKESIQKLLADHNAAFLRLGEWARKTFSLAELDEEGHGVTIAEALAILKEYSDWSDSVKKNIELTPISQPPTELEKNSITKPGVGSISTENASSTVNA